MSVGQILAWTVPPSVALALTAWAVAWSKSFSDDEEDES